jgi:hypothetical protein
MLFEQLCKRRANCRNRMSPPVKAKISSMTASKESLSISNLIIGTRAKGRGPAYRLPVRSSGDQRLDKSFLGTVPHWKCAIRVRILSGIPYHFVSGSLAEGSRRRAIQESAESKDTMREFPRDLLRRRIRSRHSFHLIMFIHRTWAVVVAFYRTGQQFRECER